jgi:Sensors of blue-light using FAD
MEDLHALVYVSNAVRRLTDDEIASFLVKARARNEKLGVTGVLLYSDGNFMQYLEGSAQALAEIYPAIKASPLHQGIIELLRERIQSREFADWSMGYRKVTRAGAAAPFNETQSLLAKLSPPNGPSSAAHMLLTKFWNRGLGQSAP